MSYFCRSEPSHSKVNRRIPATMAFTSEQGSYQKKHSLITIVLHSTLIVVVVNPASKTISRATAVIMPHFNSI